MLKYIKHYVSTEVGADVLGIIALIIFMLVFVLVAYYALFGMRQEYADEMAHLPLEDDDETSVDNELTEN